jgi:hypothetical protein
VTKTDPMPSSLAWAYPSWRKHEVQWPLLKNVVRIGQETWCFHPGFPQSVAGNLRERFFHELLIHWAIHSANAYWAATMLEALHWAVGCRVSANRVPGLTELWICKWGK